LGVFHQAVHEEAQRVGKDVMKQLSTSRRKWLGTCGVCTAAAMVVPHLPAIAADVEAMPDPLAGRLKKTLKVRMVKTFLADLPVDGSVCGQHWQIRHTSPDAETRKQALANLTQAIRDTHAVGGHSVLVVVGKGGDGPEEEIWKRSVENISQAVPLAAELGVQILIENVWNQFLYNHDGGADQSAEKFAAYVDDFKSPWVGMQFDIGNHWKYGATGDWIRLLGSRIRKLDVKGFSRAENQFTAIGGGDIDFADVRKALREINFHGWVAAEVAGGGQAYLQGVANEMNEAFGL
jgi:L-ribulose-5-phosphate 3-epimerase